MDLFSRQVVGWAMDKHMKVELVLEALKMDYWRRKPPAGLIHHSNRSIQYACDRYQRQLETFQIGYTALSATTIARCTSSRPSGSATA